MPGEPPPSTVLVTLHGDLDLSRADEITRAVDDAMARDGVRDVVIDLAAVTFVDSTCLGAFIRTHSRATAAGIGLTLVNANRRVRRVLDMTRLADMLVADDHPPG